MRNLVDPEIGGSTKMKTDTTSAAVTTIDRSRPLITTVGATTEITNRNRTATIDSRESKGDFTTTTREVSSINDFFRRL